jgi:hypothetical protein
LRFFFVVLLILTKNRLELMGPTRFERVTSRLSAVRSYLAKLRARTAVCIGDPINNSFPVCQYDWNRVGFKAETDP